jgi:hypothetical protein
VRRFHQPDDGFIADAIYEIDHPVRDPCVIFDFETEAHRTITGDIRGITAVGEAVGFPQDANSVPYSAAVQYTDLLVPIFRKGELVYQVPILAAARDSEVK